MGLVRYPRPYVNDLLRPLPKCLRIYWDNGKQNENYYIAFRVIRMPSVLAFEPLDSPDRISPVHEAASTSLSSCNMTTCATLNLKNALVTGVKGTARKL